MPAPTLPVRPPSSPLTFTEAKRELRALYADGQHRSIYGDCPFQGWSLDWSRCCLDPEPGPRRRLEWEHAVPAAALGRHLPSWKRGHARCIDSRGKRFRGRRCARLASSWFRQVEGDLHNLFPAIGVLNEARADHGIGLVAGEPRRWGRCDFEVAAGRVEPREGARGDIARAYLYMNAAYPEVKVMDASLGELLLQWHRSDPPDAWERRRNDFAAARQGNRNPWIDAP